MVTDNVAKSLRSYFLGISIIAALTCDGCGADLAWLAGTMRCGLWCYVHCGAWVAGALRC